MGKKLKALAGSLTENQFAQTVKGSAQQIWLAGLGAFAKAQEEGGKVFDVLVKEGESVQTKTRKMTDEKLASVDRVARALGSLGVPSQKDLNKLSQRIDELTDIVLKLKEVKSAPPTSAKPAAKTSTKAVTKKPVVRKSPAKAVAQKSQS